MTLRAWLSQTSFILLSCGVAAPPAQAGDERSQSYNLEIDALPLMAAIETLSDQTGIEVLFFSEVADGVISSPVQGEFTPKEALKTMLTGTELELVDLDQEGAVAIRPIGEAPNTGKSRPASSPVLMAQSQTPAERIQSNRWNQTGSDSNDEGLRQLEEIIVVGTQIRGAGAAGANVISLDRNYIELGGFATTTEILQSLPQNFAGGSNELTEVVNTPGGFNNNPGFASSVNLRGLGTASTLMLINGRRAASGGGFGSFVDINSVPPAAIERIEVLPDGASAVYGSDAIAGVVNIVLRDDYEGAETNLRYAPGTSDINELSVSQIFGHRWRRGGLLSTVEYYDRSDLESKDRVYTRDSDLRPLGGSDTSTNISNPGNILDPTPFSTTVLFAIPEGQDGTSLTPSELLAGTANVQNAREGTTVLPAQERRSASLLLFQELSDNIELFADVRYSRRDYENRNKLITNPFDQTASLTVPSSNPFFVDPFGGSTEVRVAYSFVDDYGAPRSSGRVETIGTALGATFDLSDSWQLEVYGSHGNEETTDLRDKFPNSALLAEALADPNPGTAFNPFGDGSNTNPATLASIEGFDQKQIQSELSVFNARADGNLFDISGGAVKLAVGVQYRDESLESDRLTFTRTAEPVPSSSTTFVFDLTRDVTAAFAEFFVPLVSKQNQRMGVKRLDLSVAARYENYSDFGDTFDPKVGVSWSPTDGLTLRSTYGTSFRAPLLTDINTLAQTFQTIPARPDPLSPTGFSNAIYLFGSSPELIPEEGETLTVGLDITPKSIQGFRASLTYFSTEIDQLIAVPAETVNQPLLNPKIFASTIRRVPGDADLTVVQALLDDPRCFCFLPASEINAIIDFRLNNLTKSEFSGVDIDLQYGVESDFGAISLTLYVSHLLDFKEQAFASAPLEDQLDTIFKPNSLKARRGLQWNNGDVHAALFGNYIGDYTDTFSDPERKVGSWTTWDVDIGYDFSDRGPGFLDGFTASVNVRNIFDRDPPFADLSFGVGFDPIAANPYGRFLAIQLSKVW